MENTVYMGVVKNIPWNIVHSHFFAFLASTLDISLPKNRLWWALYYIVYKSCGISARCADSLSASAQRKQDFAPQKHSAKWQKRAGVSRAWRRGGQRWESRESAAARGWRRQVLCLFSFRSFAANKRERSAFVRRSQFCCGCCGAHGHPRSRETAPTFRQLIAWDRARAATLFGAIISLLTRPKLHWPPREQPACKDFCTNTGRYCSCPVRYIAYCHLERPRIL